MKIRFSEYSLVRAGIIVSIIICAGLYSLTLRNNTTYIVSPSAVYAQSGVTYYVDSAIGSDTNSGLTQDEAFATIQKAADSVQAGDVVMVRSGTYNRTVITTSGNSSQPIVFQAEIPAVQAGHPANSIATQGVAVTQGFQIQADHVHLVGFEITDTYMDGHNQYDIGSGVYIRGKYNKVLNSYIHHTAGPGVQLYAQRRDSNDTSFATIQDNTIHDVGDANVWLRGTNHLIQGNDLSRPLVEPRSTSGDVLWTNRQQIVDADPIRMFGNDHVLRRNYIHDTSHNFLGNENAHLDWIEAGPDWRRCIIEQNIFYHPGTHRHDKPGFGSKGIVASTAAGSTDGEIDDIVIRNNIFIHNGSKFSPLIRLGIEGEPVMTNVAIMYNTFIRPKTTENFLDVRNVDQLIVQNNIFYSGADGSVGFIAEPYWDFESVANDIVGNNLFYAHDGQYPSQQPWQDDVWAEDPLFLDYTGDEWGEYALGGESPAIDAGIQLTSGGKDYNDLVRPQGSGFDMGAHEWIENDGDAPAVHLIKVANRTTAQSGDDIVYTVTLTNDGATGDVSAYAVTVNDIIPAGTTYQSSTPNAVVTDGVLTWPTVPVLAPGDVHTYTFVVTIDSPASM